MKSTDPKIKYLLALGYKATTWGSYYNPSSGITITVAYLETLTIERLKQIHQAHG